MEDALTEHKQQAKLIVRRLSPNSEPMCSIESGAYTLQSVVVFRSHRRVKEGGPSLALLCIGPATDDPTDAIVRSPSSYLISGSVIYLVISERSYPRKLAFSYLDELAREFSAKHGDKVDSTTRPYAFVGFGESLARQFPQLPHGKRPLLTRYAVDRLFHVQDRKIVQGLADNPRDCCCLGRTGRQSRSDQ